MADIDNIVTLGVGIDGAQAEATAKRIGSGLQEMGQKGEAAAAQIAASGNTVTAGLVKQYATLQDAQRAWVAEATAIKHVTDAQAELARRQTESIITQMRLVDAVQQNAGAINNVNAAAGSAVGGLGRLRQSFASLAAMGTGTSPVIDRIITTLGSFAVGNVWIIAVLAGIAAIGFAWKAVHKEADDLAKSAKKATDELFKMNDAKMLGSSQHITDLLLGTTPTGGGGLLTQIANDTKERDVLQKHLDNYEQFNLKSRAQNELHLYELNNNLNAEIALRNNSYASLKDIEREHTQSNEEIRARELADQIKSKRANTADRAEALALYKTDLAAYTALQEAHPIGPEAQAANLAQRRQLRPSIDALESALFPKGEATRAASAQNTLQGVTDDIKRMQQAADDFGKDASINTRVQAIIDHLDRLEHAKGFGALHDQIEQAKRDATTAGDALIGKQDQQGTQAIKAQADAIRLENEALRQGATDRETYLINKTADLQITQAKLITNPDARAARIAEIEDLRQVSVEHVRIQQTIMARNAAEKKADSEAQRVLKDLLNQMQRSTAQFFTSIFEGGVTSFKSLFTEVRNMFAKLIADLLAAKVFSAFGDKIKGLLTSSPGVDPLLPLVGISTQPAAASRSTLATVASFAGIGGAILGGIGILSSIFGGESAAQREQNDILKSNIKALQDNTLKLSGFTVTGSNTAVAATLLQALYSPANKSVVATVFQRSSAGILGADEGAQVKALQPLLTQYGITLQQLNAIAQQYGVTIYDSHHRLVEPALKQLAASLSDAAKAAFTFGKTLTDQQNLATLRDKLAGKTSPADDLARNVTLLQTLAPKLLTGTIDTKTAAGQAALRAQLASDVAKAVAGTLNPSDFGQLQNINDFSSIVGAITDSLNGMNTAIGSVTATLTNVPAGYKIALDRFNATIPGVPPSITGTDTYGGLVPTPIRTVPIPHASSAPVTTNVTLHIGTLTTQAKDAETLLDELGNALRSELRRGGTSPMALAIRQAAQ